MSTHVKTFRFPMTLSGKLEYEMKFRLMSERGTVREIFNSSYYEFEFIQGVRNGSRYNGNKGGITVIK